MSSPHNKFRAQPVWALGLALLVAAPFLGVYPVYLMKALCFAMFACAFNLLLGFTGLLSFGHAAFMGSAAYVTGWLIRSAGWSPDFGLLAGTARIATGSGGEFLMGSGDSAWLAAGSGRQRYSIDGGGELLLVRVEWPAAAGGDAGIELPPAGFQ